MVYGFLKQSGGHVDVASTIGKGTTFRLYLPLTSEHLAEASPRSDAPKRDAGTEMILLVEDEEPIRRLCARVLSSRGYHVLAASNGEEALKLAHTVEGKLDLLVSDIMMPRMGGRQLATQLRREWPRLRVLFLSGCSEDLVPEDEWEGCGGFLQKPFTPMALTGKVRELLDMADPAKSVH